MEVKVKSVKAKEASVSIGLDVVSAEVLRLFMVKAVDRVDMSEIVLEICTDLNEEIGQDDIDAVIAGVISGLAGEVA